MNQAKKDAIESRTSSRPPRGYEGWQPMRHRLCGKIALFFAPRLFVTQGKQPVIRHDDIVYPNGYRLKRAGEAVRCPRCGVNPLGLTPEHLAVDEGPDRRESPWQRLVLAVASAITGRWRERTLQPLPNTVKH